MARWLSTAVCCLAVVAVAHALPTAPAKTPFTVPCQFTPTGGVALGHTFDLTELQGQIFSASDSNYVYKLSVCGVLPERSCQLSGGGLCQYTSLNGIYVHSLMSWTSVQQPIWNLINPKDKNSGLTLQFTNGDTCFNMGQRVSRVVNLNFPCKSDAGVGNAYSVANTAQSPCVYTVNFPTATTCFDYVPSSGPGKLSGLGILLVLLLVVVPVYVGGGCLYKRQKLGVSGWEACPNLSFWQQFPSYVKDGGRYAYHKVRYCGKDTSDGDI